MYAPHTARDVAQMLDAVGVKSLEELLPVPEELALRAELDVVPALPEYAIVRRFDDLAKKNPGASYRSFLGAGAYRHYAPPAIAALAMRGEFLTAYTPYQAEVSQGYLQAIYEWQTLHLFAHRDGRRQRVGLRRRDGARRSGDHGAQRDRTPQDPRLARGASELSRGPENLLRRSRRRHRRNRLHERRHQRRRSRRARRGRQGIRRRRAPVAELLRKRRHAAAGCLRRAARQRDDRNRGRRRGALDGGAGDAGILGRADRRRRSAEFRRSGRLRRSVCRLHRDDARAHAAHSRPPGRQDRRQRRTHRVRAHAPGARTAHPPRARHVEHLHQPSPLRADRDDLSRADGQDGLARRGRAQRRAFARTRHRRLERRGHRFEVRRPVLQRVRRRRPQAGR